jgi:hypothetical protein
LPGSRSRELIFDSAAAVDHSSFAEQIIGVAAIKFLAVNNCKIPDYWTAEILAREAAARLLPQLLHSHSQLVDPVTSDLEVQQS